MPFFQCLARVSLSGGIEDQVLKIPSLHLIRLVAR